MQKLLERLEGKGHVARSRGGEAITFTAGLDREELISRRLLDVADKLCGGSLTALLMNLVRSRPLTAGELQELQALVEQERSRRGKSRNRPR